MANNIYGVILAGGKGTRMGNVERPKQFMEVGGKPIIVHTIEKFAIHTEFDKIIILSPKAWISHTNDLIKKYIPMRDKLVVIQGGSTRNETIMNGIRYIEENFGLDEDTIIVTHDSVRPFVTHRMIEENIQAAMAYGACHGFQCGKFFGNKCRHLFQSLAFQHHTEIISTGHQIDSVHFREVVNTLSNMVKTMTSLRCHAHFDQCYNFFTICLIPVNDCMITANRLV